MQTPNAQRRPPITDSPWYWVYLFCTAGLVALVLAGPKFAARQAQIERNYESRQHAAQLAAGRAQADDEPTPQRTGTRIELTPLYITLGAVLCLAWCVLWWRRFRVAATTAEPVSIEKVTE